MYTLDELDEWARVERQWRVASGGGKGYRVIRHPFAHVMCDRIVRGPMHERVYRWRTWEGAIRAARRLNEVEAG